MAATLKITKVIIMKKALVVGALAVVVLTQAGCATRRASATRMR
ncbi:hypothetical protein LMG28614_03847 [Paraburkholderia ultramafica]|uniref:Uncharacterized protein n=1 Tax=Paraburkholderia ultramafica TaxID=1544867 RepID=A0A6S7CNI7_9BURK|nr:hypothetical protein LMG28614_03847 [Paraburkholderia ultramafica]